MSRRPSSTRRARSAAVGLALIVAACGSDDSTGGADTVTATTAVDTTAEPPGDEPTTTAAPPDTTTPDATTADSSPPDVTTPELTSAPDSTAPPESTTPPDPGPPATECRIVTDFDGEDDSLWVVVDDGVMGGLSEGAIEFGESEIRFSGTVVTDGGGFTSIRRPIDGELAGAVSLQLRIRPDGRDYGVTLRSDAVVGNRTVSYDGEIGSGPVEGDGYQVVTVEFADFRPTVFGTPVDAPPFDPDAATELGIIIADGIDGEFRVDVDWIDACD